MTIKRTAWTGMVPVDDTADAVRELAATPDRVDD
jgi:hypothetical protein